MPRKEMKTGLPAMGLVSVALLALFILAAGSSVIWNKTQIHTLGQQIRSYESRLEIAKQRRLLLERNYTAMCSQAEIEEQARKMKLGLGPPQPEQMVRLQEAPIAGASDDRLVATRKFIRTEEGTN